MRALVGQGGIKENDNGTNKGKQYKKILLEEQNNCGGSEMVKQTLSLFFAPDYSFSTLLCLKQSANVEKV